MSTAGKCKVCEHKHRASIEKEIIDKKSIRSIAKKYHLAPQTITRHAEHMPKLLTERRDTQEVLIGEELTNKIYKCLEKIEIMINSCDDYLRDPNNPNMYYMGPRATDLMVVYYEKDEKGRKKQKPKKASLQLLIDKIESEDIIVDYIETKYADPRDLLNKAAMVLQSAVKSLLESSEKIRQWKKLELEEEKLKNSNVMIMEREIKTITERVVFALEGTDELLKISGLVPVDKK